MRQRTWLALVFGGILAGVALMTAQSFQSPTTQRGDGSHIRVTGANVTVTRLWPAGAPSASVGGQTTWSGNVAIQANGVTILADRAVLNTSDNGDPVEYQVEGNVRVRVPAP